MSVPKLATAGCSAVQVHVARIRIPCSWVSLPLATAVHSLAASLSEQQYGPQLHELRAILLS
jgi:hypothetical protein